jgi:transcription elongation factor SPT5
MNAEDEAAMYKERYGRSSAVAGYKGDMEHMPQRLLIPSVNDPKLWLVKCKVNISLL